MSVRLTPSQRDAALIKISALGYFRLNPSNLDKVWYLIEGIELSLLNWKRIWGEQVKDEEMIQTAVHVEKKKLMCKA
ncbi:hypothetical protein Bpfe_001463 [Biomphalaria pfeifferi]|uniref:Uncharacterized protein n=1 Tax=Biomphalaria pfeifferi TaxID=112525 RepID=A0AAD8CAA6_BIOPF|nr:hypothetical protein Bpfe_001463 [Biomphalaria pfeifferi]